ncbi:MAG: S-adenosylmethionine:tRNA ribosyltransferase-isomerase, partial [Dehalococcoidales bacterium]|nr:S-adenosylmethionine:tRNA ribosyltransferase-isomerase [Dehalococcoidales bacterium]
MTRIPTTLKTTDFDYHLPPERIAQTPIEPRDSSKLMVISRENGSIRHRVFRDIVEYLQPGDVLVCNESRVIPARLFGRKAGTGGKVEVLLIAKRGENVWEALVKPGRRLREGTRIEFGSGPTLTPAPSKRERGLVGTVATSLVGEILEGTATGTRLIAFDSAANVEKTLEELGVVPLPPYVHAPLGDPERYQTIYARTKGSVAA